MNLTSIASANLTFILAQEPDIDTLVSVDVSLCVHAEKEKHVMEAIKKNSCYLFQIQNKVIGYAILDMRYVHSVSIEHVFIHPYYRGKKFASQFLKFIDGLEGFLTISVCLPSIENWIYGFFIRKGYEKVGLVFNPNRPLPDYLFTKNKSSRS